MLIEVKITNPGLQPEPSIILDPEILFNNFRTISAAGFKIYRGISCSASLDSIETVPAVFNQTTETFHLFYHPHKNAVDQQVLAAIPIWHSPATQIEIEDYCEQSNITYEINYFDQFDVTKYYLEEIIVN